MTQDSASEIKEICENWQALYRKVADERDMYQKKCLLLEEALTDIAKLCAKDA